MIAITGNARTLLRVIGAMNVALLFFVTPLYGAGTLERLAPTLFADAGIFVIALWGLVYLAVSEDPARYGRLFSILALEKAFYACTWVAWLQEQGGALPALFDADPLGALFFAGYGLWDGACAVVLWILWRHFGAPRPATDHAAS